MSAPVRYLLTPSPYWPLIPDRVGVYVYRIRNTGASSAKFGPCEVCGKHVSEVFMQAEGVSYLDPEWGIQITEHECGTLFGHEKCLSDSRR